MGAPSDDDGFAGSALLFGVGWVHANTQRRDVPTFIRYADTDHADVSWEERAQEAHPRDNDRKRLIVAKENVVGLIGRGAKVRTERARGFLRRT